MPNREKKRKAIHSAQRLKVKVPADSKQDAVEMLTALEDIILILGMPNTETGHQIKLIAERAIAKAQGKFN